MSQDSDGERTSYRVVAWAVDPPEATADIPRLPLHGGAGDAIPTIEEAARYANVLTTNYPDAHVQVVRCHRRRILQLDPDGIDKSSALPSVGAGEESTHVAWHVDSGSMHYQARSFSDAAVRAYKFNDAFKEGADVWESLYTDIGRCHAGVTTWFRGDLSEAEWKVVLPDQDVPPELLVKTRGRKLYSIKTKPASLLISAEEALALLDTHWGNKEGYEIVGPNRRKFSYEYTTQDAKKVFSRGMVSSLITIVDAPENDPATAKVNLTWSTDLSQFQDPALVLRAMEAAKDSEAQGLGKLIWDLAQRGMGGPGLG